MEAKLQAQITFNLEIFILCFFNRKNAIVEVGAGLQRVSSYNSTCTEPIVMAQVSLCSQ